MYPNLEAIILVCNTILSKLVRGEAEGRLRGLSLLPGTLLNRRRFELSVSKQQVTEVQEDMDCFEQINVNIRSIKKDKKRTSNISRPPWIQIPIEAFDSG